MSTSSGIISHLLKTIDFTAPFGESARKIASFVKRTEERFEAPEIAGSLLNDIKAPRELEYILFSLLDVSRADFDILLQAIPLRHLKRLVHRANFYPDALSDGERTISAELHEKLSIATVNELIAASRNGSSIIRRLSEEDDVSGEDRNFLATLLFCEAAALKSRSEWLSDHVDSYNMKAIARLLPLLSLCDELTATVKEIASRIANSGQLGRAILTFEYALRSDSFEKWVKKARKEPSLNKFLDMIQLQRARLIPVRSLIAISTLARKIHDSDVHPVIWITFALNASSNDGFRIDAGSKINDLKQLLSLCNIIPNGTIISGTFNATSYLQWTGTDMLTRTQENDEHEPSPKELVLRCLSNDALLLRLLENPKIAGTPGLIALIAYNSRSLSVLQKIAISKELHSGHANNGVPAALLKNPTHVPITLLRQFINTRYVTLMEMKEILRNPSGVRREIFSEVKAYLDQRYK